LGDEETVRKISPLFVEGFCLRRIKCQ